MGLRASCIVVVDLSWEGHVPQYHKYFIRSILNRNYQVLSISPAREELLKWSKSLSKVDQKRFTSIHTYSEDNNNPQSIKARGLNLLIVLTSILQRLAFPKTTWLKKALSVIENWTNLNFLINEYSSLHNANPKVVFIGYLDYGFMFPGITAKVIDSVFHFPWAGVYLAPKDFRTSIPYRKKSIVEQYFPSCDILMSKNVIAIFISDEGVINSITKYVKAPVFFLPELMEQTLPASESKLARLIKRKAGNRKIVSLLGVIAERKGIELLVDSANELLLENVFFLVAGKVHKEKQTDFVLSKLSTLQENNYTYLETIEGDEYFNELIQLSDIIFLVYKGFYHGSGILTKAAYFRKPLIATKGHCIGDRVEKYKIGITIGENNVEQCIDSIKSLINNNFLRPKPEFNDYLELHSIETFNKSMNEFIKLLN